MTRLLDVVCVSMMLAIGLTIGVGLGLPLAWEIDRRLAPAIEWEILPEPEPMRGVGV